MYKNVPTANSKIIQRFFQYHGTQCDWMIALKTKLIISVGF